MHGSGKICSVFIIGTMVLCLSGVVDAADMWWTPVGASGEHQIFGDEIVVTPGQRVLLELKLSGWSPRELSIWQGALESTPLGQTCSGGSNPGAPCFTDAYCLGGGTCLADRPGPIVAAVQPCTTDADCAAAFDEPGADCDEEAGICHPGWQNFAGRSDFVIQGGLSLVDTSTARFRYGSSVLFGPTAPDLGAVYYGGHLALDVPADATGSYAVALAPDGDTFMIDEFGIDIAPINVGVAIITVICTSDAHCDDGLYCTGQETCVDGNCVEGVFPCDAGIECDELNNICLVNCALDTDCDDGNDCTQNLCVASFCSYPPAAAGLACGDQTDTECDNPNTCDGAGSCQDNFELPGVACGDATSTQCDNPDSCDGAGTCVENFAAAGTPCDSGDVCLGAGGCEAGVCVETPASAAPLVARLGSLSIDVTPQPPASTAPVTLRVTSPDWDCIDLYIAADGSLVPDPIAMLPSEWGTINVPGPEIVPLSTYEVVAECGGIETAAGSGMTGKYGDYDDDNDVDFRDISFSVQAFLDVSVAPLVLVDIAPCPPDGTVDFLDISRTVAAFLDEPYRCELPCP